jgi:hypothetical protein
MAMDDFGDDMPASNFDDDTGLDQSRSFTWEKKKLLTHS